MPEKKTYPVNLPETKFSMRADLPVKEPAWLDFWAKGQVYSSLNQARSQTDAFVLHDGPPYANGPIHMGHALNKTLKDMVLRYKALCGFRVPYIPGWDCHGLPIEQALLKELKISKKEAMNDPVGFRGKCREFVRRMIDLQRCDFVRLGLLGDWEHPYITMEPEYAAGIVEAFVRLYQKGYITKGKKPVFWCIHCETALAQAEVEYAPKTSPSIYVAFPVKGKNFSLAIWTTTPWTLPANRAAVVHPKAGYGVLELADGRRIVVVDNLKETLAAKLQAKPTGESFRGDSMKDWILESPLAKVQVPVLCDDSVALEEGTGIVHCAPGHGDIDFLWGQRFGLEIASPVTENGSFSDGAGWPELAGRRVSEEDTTRLLFQILGPNLLSSGRLEHSYPHCWRCKNPVIFRATEQWFLRMSHENLREKLLAAIDAGEWLPSASKERIRSMVQARPDWCLSRQRIWGAPIPILYCRGCGKINDQAGVFEELIKRVRAQGEDFWFEPEGSFLKELGARFACGHCRSVDFVRDPNILDVWLDSGVSWLAVLEQKGLGTPCDLYLEGSDQHRGWFQTSLIASVALTGRAPYKAVFTNGWVLDEQGRAMHKSLGNVVSPQEIVKTWGADILRLWASGASGFDDVRVSERLMKLHGENYKKIRNTLRFLLGNLSDFNPRTDGAAEWTGLGPLERWALMDLRRVVDACRNGYESYDFPRVMRSILDFTIHDLSNFYFDISKDRLYTFRPDDPDRRATQSVLFVILHYLITLLSPILPFTAEEVWQELLNLAHGREPLNLCNVELRFPNSCHLLRFPTACADWNDLVVERLAPPLLELRRQIHQQLDALRQNGELGSSLQAKVTIQPSEDLAPALKQWMGYLPTVFLVSDVELNEKSPNGSTVVRVAKAPGSKCARCWVYHPCVGEDSRDTALCSKCIKVLFG